MSPPDGYATPGAFRRALTDRLKALAAEGRWTLPQLQRQIAYDRLLERLYLVDEGWVVKGATALLARELGMRATVDIDLYRAAARDQAEGDLRRAAGMDLGDWFRFEVGPAHQLTADVGTRLPVTAYVGPTVWQAFRVDLVGPDLLMTGQPDPVPPLVRVMMPNVEQHGYRVYPLVDHVADKVAATFQRYGSESRPSTRYRDLVDLVAIVTSASVRADEQTSAIRSEFIRRNLDLPGQFDVPDRALWAPGYAAEARRSLLPPRAGTLDRALEVVRPFVDPVLNGTATGTWNPGVGHWRG